MGLNKRLIDQAGSAGGAASTDNFDIVTYTGNGNTQSISSLNFQPDLVWIKERTSTSNNTIIDVVRGTNSQVYTNLTNAATTSNFTSFDSNGFTLGTDNGLNENTQDYVAWCWRAAGFANNFNVLENGVVTSSATASGAGITSGNITTNWKVSANRDSGFSIGIYDGNGQTNQTIGHGLSSAPELVIVKNRTSSGYGWPVLVAPEGSLLFTRNLELTNAHTSVLFSAWWSSGIPTSTTFRVGNNSIINGADDYVFYCFHSVDGYQKIGSYTASGSWGTSVSIDVGFAPRFVMVKSIDNAGDWLMVDNLRGGSNGQDRARLYANSSGAEGADTSVDFSGNTFSITFGSTGNQGTPNVSKYFYLAIA